MRHDTQSEPSPVTGPPEAAAPLGPVATPDPAVARSAAESPSAAVLPDAEAPTGFRARLAAWRRRRWVAALAVALFLPSLAAVIQIAAAPDDAEFWNVLGRYFGALGPVAGSLAVLAVLWAILWAAAVTGASAVFLPGARGGASADRDGRASAHRGGRAGGGRRVWRRRAARLVEKVGERWPRVSTGGCFDPAGQPLSPEAAAQDALLRDYRLMQYDLLFGDQHFLRAGPWGRRASEDPPRR